MNKGVIKSFVRDTLGCTCPDSVFESIELVTSKDQEGINEYRRLVIGERLLIYLLDTDSVTDWSRSVLQLSLEGKHERDARALNRFRLVLGADNPEQIEPQAKTLFDQVIDRDEKMHLHVVSSSALDEVV
jgi:hypothetical protein